MIETIIHANSKMCIVSDSNWYQLGAGSERK